MNFQQRGAYHTLLMVQASVGSMPIELIQSILGSDFASIWPMICKKFSQDDNGAFFNEKMRSEIDRQTEYSKSRSYNRSKKICQTYDNHMSNICKTYEDHMGTGTGTGTNTESGKEEREKKTKATPSWKNSYDEYKKEHDAQKKAFATQEWVSEQKVRFKALGINLDIIASLKKAADFWYREAGWEHKRKEKTKTINWKATYEKALAQSFNQVLSMNPND
jgi:hypothetical protein